jgi:hypothetical protein
MTTDFTPEDIRNIEKTLGVEARDNGNHVRFELPGSEPGRALALEVYPRIPIGQTEGTLITVFTAVSNLQLQHCSGFVFSELLGEVTFIADAGGKISGLIVEKEGGCSMYANVDRSLLSGDFTKLGPEVMLSGLALSLAEDILPFEGDALPEK